MLGQTTAISQRLNQHHCAWILLSYMLFVLFVLSAIVLVALIGKKQELPPNTFRLSIRHGEQEKDKSRMAWCGDIYKERQIPHICESFFSFFFFFFRTLHLFLVFSTWSFQLVASTIFHSIPTSQLTNKTFILARHYFFRCHSRAALFSIPRHPRLLILYPKLIN